MYIILLTIVIILFIAMLFLNIYFRVKVFKAYKKLVQNNVDFGSVHFFNAKRMESEILPKYPQHKDDILTFVSYIRYSIKMATVLVFLITLFGAVLMWYR